MERRNDERFCVRRNLLLINALALLLYHIGSGFSQTIESEEALLPKLLITKHICITATLSKVRGDCRCIGDWSKEARLCEQKGGGVGLRYLRNWGPLGEMDHRSK